MNKITELREAINNSDMNPEVKSEINNFIETTVKIHLRVPILYYVAGGYGLVSLIFGVIFTMLLVALCGLGVLVLALVGILEVICTRRKIGGIND